jgi:hypothetical protein
MRTLVSGQLAAEVVAVGPAVVGVEDAGTVVVDVAAAFPCAIACSKAASVAASTAPVGGTPRSVWKRISASVSSGVH